MFTNVLWTLLFFTLVKTDENTRCIKTGPCQCAMDKYRVIDLTFLAKEVKTPPRFANVPVSSPPDNDYFFYHPCESFKMGDDTRSTGCHQQGGVAVCHQYKNDSYEFTQSFGKQDSAEFQYNSTVGMFQISYSDVNTSTVILLKCVEGAVDSALTVDQLIDNQTCYMTLKSRCACANGCIPNDLSVGSILLILFTVCVFLYLVGGMLYQYCVCGAAGMEIIPNYEFWMDFPYLVRDGIVFVLKCCRTEPTYDRI